MAVAGKAILGLLLVLLSEPGFSGVATHIDHYAQA